MSTTLRRQAAVGLRVLLLFTVLCGIAFPLLARGVSRIPGLSHRAGGPVVAGGGSSPVGMVPVVTDTVADPFFHARPAASSVEVATASAGPAAPHRTDPVAERRTEIAEREGVDPAVVPADAVTTAPSGLDPHVSLGYANLQVARVARVTGLPVADVCRMVDESTSGRLLGALGERVVNTTTLNLAVSAARSP
ncbi:MAG: potassium-transporting ATPase subunit C [Pseudonocardia sp.]|nr:potassium-transporting ATPase subunit C [Pseudonocardia sp.]